MPWYPCWMLQKTEQIVWMIPPLWPFESCVSAWPNTFPLGSSGTKRKTHWLASAGWMYRGSIGRVMTGKICFLKRSPDMPKKDIRSVKSFCMRSLFLRAWTWDLVKTLVPWWTSYLRRGERKKAQLPLWKPLGTANCLRVRPATLKSSSSPFFSVLGLTQAQHGSNLAPA